MSDVRWIEWPPPSGFDLFGSLFGSPWAWQLVGLGALAAVVVMLVFYGLFLRGQAFERRVQEEVEKRGAGLQPGKRACPSPEVHHDQRLKEPRGDAP